MSWETWENVEINDIIKKEHFTKLQENLNFLSNIDIETGDNNAPQAGEPTGRCIGYYATVYATNNSTVKSHDGSETGATGHSTNFSSRYGVVDTGAQKCSSGYCNNVCNNHWK